MLSTWVNDCKKYTPWLKTVLCPAEKRKETFEHKTDIYITNHDAAKWLAKQPKQFFDKFSELIIDESGAYKHHTSQRSKAMQKIKKYFPIRTAMNGTPNPNTILDLWHQVNLIDDGQRLGQSFFAFRSAVCTPEQVGPKANMIKWTDREHAEAIVADLQKDIVIRNVFEECVSIPPNFKYMKEFSLAPVHAAQYRKMQKDALLSLPKGEITAVNAATVMTKLLQIASGAVYDSDGKYHILNKDRYDLVMDLAEERKYSLVFFLWKHQRDLLIEEAKKRKITYMVIDGSVSDKKREEAIQMYQAGMYRVGFLHPQSAAHSLTLTRGTASIWASPTFNLEHYLQGSRRIYRAGQTKKTETIDVIATGTIEDHVYEVCNKKGAKMKDMLGFVKDLKDPKPVYRRNLAHEREVTKILEQE